MQESIQSYIRDINTFPLVNSEKEIELGEQIKIGNAQARSTLITSNLRLVVKIAHDFKKFGFPLQDLISEGNIGLMRAAEKFDPQKGAKFSSYASWWIKQAMRRAIIEKSKLIRIPITSAGKIYKIKATRSLLRRELGRTPTTEEISEKVNLSTKVVFRLQQAEHTTVSLQKSISQNNENGFLNDLIPDETFLAPDQYLDDRETTKRIDLLLSHLELRERTILSMRLGLEGQRPKTLEEVSKKIGRTRERVRQIQNQALRKLRSIIHDRPEKIRKNTLLTMLN